MRRPRWMLRARLALLPPLFVLAFWLPGFNQGAFRVDTGLYAAIGLRAWREGPMWPLLAGDVAYFNKPPLAIWAHGWLLHVLGAELWVARLPSLLAAMGCVVVTQQVVRRMSGPRMGLIAACVLALTIEFFRYTKAVSLDVWMTLFLMVAAWCVVRAREARSAGSAVGWLALAGVPIGCALVTKPIAPLLALGVFGVWVFGWGTPRPTALEDSLRWPWHPWEWNPWRALQGLGWSAVVALVIAGAWYGPMYLRFGDAFIAQHFTKQAIERATGESFGGDPWWYYLRLMAETYWPWLVLVVVSGVLAAMGRLAARDRVAARMAIAWVLVWLVALSIFGGKSGRYAVLVYPMLAWLAAIPISGRVPRVIALARRAAVRWLWPVVMAGALAMVVFGVRVHEPAPAHWAALYEFVRGHPDEELWAGAEMRAACANVYLMTGRWPRTVVGVVPKGALVIGRDDAGPGGAARGAEMWRSGPMYVVRTGD